MARRKSYQRGNVQQHPRGSGIWTLRYREFDHATRRWITKRERLGEFKNKKAACQAADPIMARVNERNNNPESARPPKAGSEMTFKQFIEDRWKAYTVSAKHQPSTRDCYGSLIKIHLMPRFGEMRLDQITPADISAFLEKVRPKVSANTMQSFYTLLRLMFELAEQYDLIERSPVRSKLHRPETRKVEKPTLNAAEIREILANTAERERLFVLLIAVTGMRLGEALALRWMDFDAARLELQINHTLYRGLLKQPKTEGSRRSIRLVPAIAELLAQHRDRSAFQAETDFIFCRRDGAALNPLTLRTHLYKAMDAAKIKRASRKYGFHIFRHTAGTLIYTRSRDLKLVQGTLGHSNISITSDIYVHLDQDVVREGTEILAREILPNCDLIVTQESGMVS